MANPFRYSSPLAPDDLIDREVETALLLQRAFEGNNSRLVAPRRFGKTSLVRRVLRDAQDQGLATVYVDFFGALTLSDIAERIELAYARQLQGPLATWFAGARRLLRPTFQAGGGPVPAKLEVGIGPQAAPPLLERLALPRRLHERHSTRTLVVFDEFQDALAAQQRVDATIRSEIQHHGEVASYIFAGSHVGMMRQLFTDKRRAFYGQAGAVALPPLPAADVAAYVADRFSATGRRVGAALEPLLEIAAGHPQRTMLLANALWERTPPGAEATEEIWLEAYDAVMSDLRDELRAIWSGLSTGQRRVFVAVAEASSSLYASTRRYGGSRGGAVQQAVRVLLDRGEVIEDRGSATGYRVVDPLLGEWVVRGRPGG